MPLLLFALACRAPEEGAAVRDDLGRAVVVPERITRVVTLAPNLTEMVFAVGAGDELVGTDDFSDHPAPARALPKVGGMQPDIERIVQLRPDIVLASTEGNHPNLARALAAADIPLYVVRTDRLHQVAPAMRRVGELLDAPATAEAVQRLESALAAQRRHRAQPLRVLFAVWTDPLYVAGRSTFTDDLMRLAGGENAVGAEGWPQYSLESLVASPPDVLLYPRGSVSREQVEALLRRTPNVRPRVIPVDDAVFERPGPRVGEAARALNAILDAAGTS